MASKVVCFQSLRQTTPMIFLCKPLDGYAIILLCNKDIIPETLINHLSLRTYTQHQVVVHKSSDKFVITIGQEY